MTDVVQPVAPPVIDFASIGAAAVETDDLTVDKVFERELPRAGVALLRLREYVELGRHQPKNAEHKPSLETYLVFELNHPDHMQEFNGVAEPMTMKIRLNKGATAKSGYKKLFNVMNKACGGMHKHFISMINSAFLGEVYHNPSKADPKKVYANLDLQGAWSLKAPAQVDALTNTSVPIPVVYS